MLENNLALDENDVDIEITSIKNNYTIATRKRNLGYHFAKRVFDIVLSTLAFVVLSPVILISLLVVFLQDFSNPIFVQTRLTKDGKEFKMFKIRTMHVDAEERKAELMKHNEADGPVFKIEDDPRLLGKNGIIGKFLRKTSIDELLQLINIIGGSMSIVGPRPPLPNEVEQYTPYQMQRLNVKGGLTSYWGCSGRSNLSFEEWVDLDVKYINEQSFLTDIKIILLTVKSVATGDGAQ